MLKQPQYQPMETVDQIILLFANKLGLLDDVELDRIREYERELLIEMNTVHNDLMKEIEEKKVIDDNLNEKLKEIITNFTTRFRLMEN